MNFGLTTCCDAGNTLPQTGLPFQTGKSKGVGKCSPGGGAFLLLSDYFSKLSLSLSSCLSADFFELLIYIDEKSFLKAQQVHNLFVVGALSDNTSRGRIRGWQEYVEHLRVSLSRVYLPFRDFIICRRLQPSSTLPRWPRAECRCGRGSPELSART